MLSIIKKKARVAGLKSTRDDNSKGPRIGPSLFYTSKLYNKYIKLIAYCILIQQYYPKQLLSVIIIKDQIKYMLIF